MREKRDLKTWAENMMCESEFCVSRSQKHNPNQLKPEKGSYWKFIRDVQNPLGVGDPGLENGQE